MNQIKNEKKSSINKNAEDIKKKPQKSILASPFLLIFLVGLGLCIWQKDKITPYFKSTSSEASSAPINPDSEEAIEQKINAVDSLVLSGDYSAALTEYAVLKEKYGEKEFTTDTFSTFGEMIEQKTGLIQCLQSSPTKTYESHAELIQVAVQAFQIRNVEMMSKVLTCGSFFGVPDSEYDEVVDLIRFASEILGDDGATKDAAFKAIAKDTLQIKFKNGTEYEMRFDGLDKNRKVWVLKKI